CSRVVKAEILVNCCALQQSLCFRAVRADDPGDVRAGGISRVRPVLLRLVSPVARHAHPAVGHPAVRLVIDEAVQTAAQSRDSAVRESLVPAGWVNDLLDLTIDVVSEAVRLP